MARKIFRILGRDATRKRLQIPASLRIISYTILALVLLVVIGQAVLRRMMDADFIEARLSEALGRATNNLYSIRIGDAHFDLWRNHLEAIDVVLSADTSASAASPDTPPALYNVSAPFVAIDGISLLGLFRREIVAAKLHLIAPRLHLVIDAPKDSLGAPHQTADSLSALFYQSFHRRLANQLPALRIGKLLIDSASLSWERHTGRQVHRDSVPRIYVEIVGIDTDIASASDTARTLFSDDVRFRLHGYSHLSSDSLYEVLVDSIVGSTHDRSLEVHAVNITSTLSDAELKQRRWRQRTRYKIDVKRVSLHDVAYRAAFEENAATVSLVELDAPWFEAYLDRSRVEQAEREPAEMPHQLLESIDWTLRVDTLRARDGTLRYLERAADGVGNGLMRFEELAAEITGLSNSGAGRTTNLSLQSRVNGGGVLNARLQYDLGERGLNMRFSGSLSRMDAAAFNEVLEDLEGIKVEAGVLDSAWFDIDVVSDSASGDVQVLFHDLKVGFQSKSTGRRGIFNAIKGFIANTFKVKDDNMAVDGTPARIAHVGVKRTPERPFLGFLWVTIRAGLLNNIGL